MSKVYEVQVGQTRYTAEHQEGSRVPPFVTLTRYNRDGKTEIFFPTELLWKVVADKLRERVLELADTLVIKGLTTWRP